MQLSAYLTILIGVIPSMCAGVLATMVDCPDRLAEDDCKFFA